MFSSRGLVAVLSLGAAITPALVQRADAHPGCKPDTISLTQADTVFCPTDVDPLYDDGICCDAAMEAEIVMKMEAADFAGVSDTCKALYQEVLCTVCHPYSLHLYERLVSGLTMTNAFCADFYDACGAADQLDLANDYCEFHTGGSDEDQYWSYPLIVEEDTFDGELVEAFPDIDLPEQPIDMRMTPDGSKWWIVGMEGQIVEIDVSDPESPPTSEKLVMDISDDLLLSYEEGLFSVAFSPAFHSTGVFFASYTPTKRSGSDHGFNRLSRFEYDPSSATNTRNSEEILISSVDKNFDYHSAGWIGFPPSAYESTSAGSFHDLYWAMGDSGNQLDDSLQAQNPDTQHGSILRVSVNSNMGVDYEIPSGNPFSGGGGLPEICAQGFRNPFKCSFDRGTNDGTGKDDLWCGDVGNYEVESIKKVECGNNYGWRQFEGHRCTYEIDQVDNEFSLGCADSGVRDPYTFPEFSYCHPDYEEEDEPDYLFPDIVNGHSFCNDDSVYGSAVIGGFVYRGNKYGDLLGGNYLFADFQVSRLYNLIPTDDGWGTADGNKWGYGVVKGSGLFKAAGFAEANNGELYIIQYKGAIWELPCGDLCDGDGVIVETPPPSPVPPFPTPAPLPLPGAAASIGCYIDDEPRVMDTLAATSTSMTTEVCMILCEGSTYYATQNGNECWCGDASTNLELYCGDNECEDAVCGTACSGDSSQTCGGSWAMSVYQTGDVAPTPVTGPTPAPVTVGDYTELGCAADDADARVMSVGPLGAAGSDMSADICYGLCASELPAFEYFATQYSYECFCATTIAAGLFDPEYDGCTASCLGNSGETCGGTYALTVYQVGDVDVEPTPEPTPAPVPEAGDYTELGCAADDADARVMSVGPLGAAGSDMSADICYGLCASELPSFEYFATQYSFECFCATTIASGLFDPEHDGCTASCLGNSGETCGGTYALTVYQVGDVDVEPTPEPTPSPVPEAGDYTELGCAADDADARVMSVGPLGAAGSDMSADICYGLCVDELPAFEYFATQYSFECFCATTIASGLFDPEYDGCTASCLGNSGETCGGTYALTVYQVGDAAEPTPSPVPEAGDYTELGCAADPKGTEGERLMSEGPIKNFDLMSAEVCYGICEDELPGFVYFGTQYSNECFCATSLLNDVSFDPEHDGCTMSCVGNSGETCGGFDAITVYAVGDVDPEPTGEYEGLGCASDPNPGPDGGRLMSVGPITSSDGMSAEICLGICEDELPGFSYFGTQYSVECFCSSSLANDVTFDHDGCDASCAGNSGETCGGTDAITVYSV